MAATYVCCGWTQRSRRASRLPPTSHAGLTGRQDGGVGIVATAVVLLCPSAFDIRLGWPTCLAGAATAPLVMTWSRFRLAAVAKDISWGVLPLVAGLFVLVEALDQDWGHR